MRKIYKVFYTCIVLLSLQSHTMWSAERMTPYRKKLLTYMGLSTLGTYVSLNLLNKNADIEISQKRLMMYSAGIPTMLGLGLYLGSLKRPAKHEIAQSFFDEKDSKKFIGTYMGLSTLVTWSFLCGTSKITGNPPLFARHAIDACGYTGTCCGIITGAYFASLLWADTGLFQMSST